MTKVIKVNRHQLKAFTLTEVLVVLVIIGILILLALPNQTAVISKAKATEAKLQLEFLYSLQKSNFHMTSKYAESLEDIGFEQVKLVSEGGTANYILEVIESNSSTFKARATAITDFDQDGNFNVWEIDQDKNLIEKIKD
jgi:type IV pilus assembly protein PilE